VAKILIAGVYMADRPNTAAHIAHELRASVQHDVIQRWAALAPGGNGRCDLPSTVLVVAERTPKFSILNRLTEDACEFDWVIFCDDDVEMAEGFLDRFIQLVETYDFALSQPARTIDSYTDHPIVQVMPGLAARRTRFVEIGPLIAVRRDAMPWLLPFPDDSGMGWGLDLVWPRKLEPLGLRLGIVDATPIAHRLRPPAAAYDGAEARRKMSWTLASHEYLPWDDAFTVLEAYA
jgi:hypothetical protein